MLYFWIVIIEIHFSEVHAYKRIRETGRLMRRETVSPGLIFRFSFYFYSIPTEIIKEKRINNPGLLSVTEVKAILMAISAS